MDTEGEEILMVIDGSLFQFGWRDKLMNTANSIFLFASSLWTDRRTGQEKGEINEPQLDLFPKESVI